MEKFKFIEKCVTILLETIRRISELSDYMYTELSIAAAVSTEDYQYKPIDSHKWKQMQLRYKNARQRKRSKHGMKNYWKKVMTRCKLIVSNVIRINYIMIIMTNSVVERLAGKI